MESSLTTIRNVSKPVRISFYTVKESRETTDDKSAASSLSRYFPSSSKTIAHGRTKESQRTSTILSKKPIASSIITQQRMEEMFEENSFVLLTFNAKLQNLERYHSWNILQQDVPANREPKNKSATRREDKEEEEDEYEEDESFSSNSKEEKEEVASTNERVELSDAMKKYHDLPLTLPTDQFTTTAMTVVCCLLESFNEKTNDRLLKVLNKEEILETIALCNYLGIKNVCT